MSALKEGDKIFNEVAKTVTWTETQTLEQVNQLYYLTEEEIAIVENASI